MCKWKTKLISTTRGRFEVFIKGKGRPICVSHHYSEFNDSGDYFADSFTDDFQVHLVNLKETGNTSKASEPHELSMFDAVYDLEAIREELGFSVWTYAGHSTGGMIGLLYGIHFSSSLSSLIIVGSAARKYANSSPACIYHEEHPEFGFMQELIETLKNPNLSPVERASLSKERTKLSLYKPEKYEEYFSLPITKKMSATRMNFFIREEMIFDVTRQLQFITTPTLIMGGVHDVQCPISFSEEMNEEISHSTFVRFNESNHYPFLEQAHLFKEEVQKFMYKV
ncbi:alpha/beta fold hydrolase [Fictibacillus phosphorivorans]|uniref:alpha/beta fold hydrolase n=1 Tax=Fictibacillus phosphorivorans TaxID=1221500 RepID=UPI00129314C9|nr:alpha/beta hydrolase [Fictibacillus phosphorivorans]MQR94407.1 alpha/beta hydrolase [Fictibacillus phosphorivorans]